MDISQLPKLKAKIDLDLTINEDNVTKKSLNSAYMYHQYLDLFLAESRELKVLSVEKDRIYGKLYEHYKFNHTQSLDSKSEIEAWIRADQKYIDIVTKFNEQEIVCLYLEKVTESINKLSFSIKNFIEFKKYLSGG